MDDLPAILLALFGIALVLTALYGWSSLPAISLALLWIALALAVLQEKLNGTRGKSSGEPQTHRRISIWSRITQFGALH